MTIDEAIAHAREVSSRKFDDRVHCIRCSEFYKQIAEWLEELSRRRVEELFKKTDEKVIRDNAIDEFADKIISLCVDGEFMNRFNEFPATTTFEIAEQLKEKR